MSGRGHTAVAIGALVGVAAAAVVGVSVAHASDTASAGPNRDRGQPRGDNAGLEQLRSMGEALDLDVSWLDFFALLALNESGGNPAAVNDRPSEAKAARIAYDRNAKRLANCGHPKRDYTFGSAGWFGQLPANAVLQFQSPKLRCLPPRAAVTDPATSLAMAIGFARGLMTWQRFKRDPRFVNLRAMWRRPDKGGDAAYIAKRVDNYREDAIAVGASPELLDVAPPALPVTADDAYSILKNSGW